ncbi:hypothetical protein C8R45DRAFT_986438 [Mycena sanguinolenta]|nr:hypothetical protein C8R45DRAFT_995411 [Mycena sanguinolenta]KAJ6495242.1 hypothetical protein C8R45DRAFT_986438 [Mycena sanguinolenta]
MLLLVLRVPDQLMLLVVLMAGIIALNANTNTDIMCERNPWNHTPRDNCRRLFYASRAFAWILTATLFSAACATHRRAVAVHGTTMTIPPPPPMVPAWRLSSGADNEAPSKEGTLKI